jgi:hypothetical protein
MDPDMLEKIGAMQATLQTLTYEVRGLRKWLFILTVAVAGVLGPDILSFLKP